MKKQTCCVQSTHLAAFCCSCQKFSTGHKRTHPNPLHIYTLNAGTPEEKAVFYCKDCCPEHGKPPLFKHAAA